MYCFILYKKRFSINIEMHFEVFKQTKLPPVATIFKNWIQTYPCAHVLVLAQHLGKVSHVYSSLVWPCFWRITSRCIDTGSCFNSLAVFRRSLTPNAPLKVPHRAGIDGKFTQCRSLTFQVYHFCAPLNLACCSFATAVVGLNRRLDMLNVWSCDPICVVRHSWSESLLEVSSSTCSSTQRVSLWTCWSALKFPACKRKLALSLLRRTYHAKYSVTNFHERNSPNLLICNCKISVSELKYSLPTNSWNTGSTSILPLKGLFKMFLCSFLKGSFGNLGD